jgi:hypothetical protein
VARTKSGDAGFDHYLGWLSNQTFAGKAKLASLSIQERLGMREKRPERGPNGEEIKSPDETTLIGDVVKQPKFMTNLNIFDLNAVDRVEMVARLQRLANSSLANEASMARFTDHMNKAAEGWSTDRLTQLETQLKEYQQDLKKNAGPDGEFIADIKAKHKVSETIFDDMRDARDVRAKQLEGALNKFLKEEGLPEVTLEAAMTEGGGAGYLLGNVIIDSRLMDSLNLSSDKAGLLYHELVHLEQDVLRISRFADRLGIGKEATPAQLAGLKDVLERRQFNSGTGAQNPLNIRDSFIESVLQRRAGVKLTEQELSVAIDYDNAVRFYDSPVKRTLHDLEKQQSQTSNSLKSLDADRAESLLLYSVNQPALFKAKYGFAEIPEGLKSLAASIGITDPTSFNFPREQVLLKVLRGANKGKDVKDTHDPYFESPFDSPIRGHTPPETRVTEPIVSQVRQILESHKSQIDNTIASRRRQSYQWYMRNIQEQQAYPVGVLAVLYAESQNTNTH